MSTKRKKLTIDRTKWARVVKAVDGTLSSPNGDSYLLNDDSNMCCLGFDARYLHDVQDEGLAGRGVPSFNAVPCSFDAASQMRMIKINDRGAGYMNISNDEQEEEIKKEFANVGVDVEFIN